MENLIQGITVALVGTAGVVALQWPRLQAQTTTQAIDPAAATAAHALQAEQLSLRKLLPSFGFGNLIADWTFLEFVQYFGDTPVREVTDYSLSGDFFQVVVDQDPFFMDAYLFLATATSFYAAQPETTVNLLSEGLKAMTPALPPDAYLLWRYKALDELLLLGEGQAAQQSFSQAADWAEQSPLPNASKAAETSRNTANFLKQDPDSAQAQVSAWFQVWSGAVNEEVQKLAADRIKALGFEIVIENDAVQLIPLAKGASNGE
ncbi:MAG: hypothetical protein O2890_02245 [Cyanobacteria bacterium]|nr:hypothetical protein [Cyanobacteriota bacterium]MDA0865237.1 hypothetical protein [Cyanobacteriota bacterium]